MDTMVESKESSFMAPLNSVGSPLPVSSASSSNSGASSPVATGNVQSSNNSSVISAAVAAVSNMPSTQSTSPVMNSANSGNSGTSGVSVSPDPSSSSCVSVRGNISAFLGIGDDFEGDLQGRLKKVSKLPNGLYETKFKIDRYKFDRAIKNELSEMNSLQELLQDIMTSSGTQIMLQMKTKSNSRLRNPLVSVIGTLEGIELAKERLLSVFENMRQRVVLKMDVSFKDHSHIIGRGGLSIQQVMDETGSHIHFPDSNRISDVKKSNVVLVCGNPHGVEQARCRIRRLLPLIVHFQIPLQLLKKVSLAAHSKHLRSIQQVYNVHVSIRYSSDIDEQFAAIFDTGRGAKYVAVSVRGVNNDLGSLREALRVLLAYLTDFSMACALTYTLTIEITEYYHQLVMGSGCANIRSIMQKTGCVLTFPEVEPTSRHLDLDNLNEIPVNKSTVIVRGPSFEAVHAAWTELIGYLPLVLTFDLAHDQRLDTGLLNTLKKQHKVAIFLKHKEKFNTVIIRGVERHSKQLFEVRRQLLGLDETEIPECCEFHSNVSSASSFDMFNNYASFNSRSNEHHMDRTTRVSVFPLDSNNNSVCSSMDNGVNGTNGANGTSGTSGTNGTNGSNGGGVGTDKSISSSLLVNPELQTIFNPAVFQAVLKEQYLVLQQQQLQQQKQKHLQALGVNVLSNGNNSNGNNSSNNSSNNSTNGNSNNNNGSIGSLPVHSSLHSNNSFMNQNGSISSTSPGNHHHHYRTSGIPYSNLDAMAHNSACDQMNQLLKQYPVNSNSSSTLESVGNNVSGSASGSGCSPPPLTQLSLNASKHLTSNASSSSMINGDEQPSSFGVNEPLSSADHPDPLNPCPSQAGNNSLPNTSCSTTLTSSTANSNMNHSVGQGIWPDSKKLSYGECKYLALKATYEEPTANEVRVPSSIWSGFGFSKSMPPEALKSKLVEWNPMLDSPGSQHSNQSSVHKYLDHLNKPNMNQMMNQYSLAERQKVGRPLLRQESEICSNSTPYSSNYLNGLLHHNNHSNNNNNNNNGNNNHNNNSNNHHAQQSNLICPSNRSMHTSGLMRSDQLASMYGPNPSMGCTSGSGYNGLRANTLPASSGDLSVQDAHISSNDDLDESKPLFINVDNIDLSIVLIEFGLYNYIDVFKQCGINFACFLRLTDFDLFRLGISYTGRRKLVAAIAELRGLLQSNRIMSNFNACDPMPVGVCGGTSKMTRLTSSSSLTNSSGINSLVGPESPNASQSNVSNESVSVLEVPSTGEEHFDNESGSNKLDDLQSADNPSTPEKNSSAGFVDDSTDEGLAGSSPITESSADKVDSSSMGNVLATFVSPQPVQAN